LTVLAEPRLALAKLLDRPDVDLTDFPRFDFDLGDFDLGDFDLDFGLDEFGLEFDLPFTARVPRRAAVVFAPRLLCTG
jgi:hypothetical protein